MTNQPTGTARDEMLSDHRKSQPIQMQEASQEARPREACQSILPPTEVFQADRVLTIGFAHAVHDLYTCFLPPLLPLIIAILSISKTQAGFLTLFLSAPSLLQPAVGHLADRLNLRYLVILAPAVTGLLMSLLGLAPSYAVLALLLVLAGISNAAFHAVAPALAGNLSGKSNLGRGMALWMVGGEVGFTLGPLLLVTLVKWFGLRSTPALAVFGALGSALLYHRLRNVARAEPMQSALRLPWRQAMRTMGPVMIPLLAVVVTRSFAMSALASYLPTFLHEAGVGFWLAGVSLTIYQAAVSAGVLVGGPLSDYLGRRSVLLVSMLFTPLCLFVFLMLGGAAQMLTLLAIGLAVSGFDPVALALVQESFVDHRALASSLYLSLSFVIRSVVVVLVGVLGDWLGLRWAFAIGGIVFLLGVPLVFLLPQESRAGRHMSRPEVG